MQVNQSTLLEMSANKLLLTNVCKNYNQLSKIKKIINDEFGIFLNHFNLLALCTFLHQASKGFLNKSGCGLHVCMFECKCRRVCLSACLNINVDVYAYLHV